MNDPKRMTIVVVDDLVEVVRTIQKILFAPRNKTLNSDEATERDLVLVDLDRIVQVLNDAGLGAHPDTDFKSE